MGWLDNSETMLERSHYMRSEQSSTDEAHQTRKTHRTNSVTRRRTSRGRAG
jgi:hypothetical protein